MEQVKSQCSDDIPIPSVEWVRLQFWPQSLPFYASVQHVQNIEMMVQCDLCGMWRLLLSKYKVKMADREYLQRLLDNQSYLCGSKLKDLDLPDTFKNVEIRDHHCNVEIRDHHCNDPIEKLLYYSANFDPVCIYCGKDQPFTVPNQYPQCEECSHNPSIKK